MRVDVVDAIRQKAVQRPAQQTLIGGRQLRAELQGHGVLPVVG
jgi:hypothetical protein